MAQVISLQKMVLI